MTTGILPGEGEYLPREEKIDGGEGTAVEDHEDGHMDDDDLDEGSLQSGSGSGDVGLSLVQNEKNSGKTRGVIFRRSMTKESFRNQCQYKGKPRTGWLSNCITLSLT